MELIEKSDLFYKDYEWTNYPEDDKHVSGETDETEFNKRNGFEMQYMIQHIMQSAGMREGNTKIKLEKMLRHELPLNIVHQDRIKIWVLLNWFNSQF